MSDRNQDQIMLVTDELNDLDIQVAAGDIDDATANSLRQKYVEELDRLMSERTEHKSIVDTETLTPTPPEDRTTHRKWGRAFAGTAIVVAAVGTIAVFGFNSLSGAGAAGAEGIVGDVVAGDGLIDLSAISNEEMEAVVAENPEVVGMRLALARRYFDAGEFGPALDHYMTILGQEQHPEALANVGWMTYISGRPDVAIGYIEAALQRRPGSLTATWFLGNIQYTLGNYPAATDALIIILNAEGVPDDVKEAARLLLADMGAG